MASNPWLPRRYKPEFTETELGWLRSTIAEMVGKEGDFMILVMDSGGEPVPSTVAASVVMQIDKVSPVSDEPPPSIPGSK